MKPLVAAKAEMIASLDEFERKVLVSRQINSANDAELRRCTASLIVVSTLRDVMQRARSDDEIRLALKQVADSIATVLPDYANDFKSI